MKKDELRCLKHFKMLKYISVLVLIIAVFYISPENVSHSGLTTRAPVPVSTTCIEKTPITLNCKSGNAFVFYNGPSTHTLDLFNTLKMLQIKATFMIESQAFTNWTFVKKIVADGQGYFRN